MGVDAGCVISNLFVQYDIFPVRKRLYTIWILYQSCSIVEFSVEFVEIIDVYCVDIAIYYCNITSYWAVDSDVDFSM